jgi:hypothetical protein
MRRPN